MNWECELARHGRDHGYVTLDDVPALLDQHGGNKDIIERLLRGQMGAATEEVFQRCKMVIIMLVFQSVGKH